LKDMNKETPLEQCELHTTASKIAQVFDGYWSIDFCRARNGQWYCIDMAEGNRSWHPKCKLKVIE